MVSGSFLRGNPVYSPRDSRWFLAWLSFIRHRILADLSWHLAYSSRNFPRLFPTWSRFTFMVYAFICICRIHAYSSPRDSTAYCLFSHVIPTSSPRDPSYTSQDSCLSPPPPSRLLHRDSVYYILETAYFLMGFPLLPLEIPLIYHGFPLVHLRSLHLREFPIISPGILIIPHGIPAYSSTDPASS